MAALVRFEPPSFRFTSHVPYPLGYCWSHKLLHSLIQIANQIIFEASFEVSRLYCSDFNVQFITLTSTVTHTIVLYYTNVIATPVYYIRNTATDTEPGANPHRHDENMQTTHRKDMNCSTRGSNSRTLSCGAATRPT